MSYLDTRKWYSGIWFGQVGNGSDDITHYQWDPTMKVRLCLFLCQEVHLRWKDFLTQTQQKQKAPVSVTQPFVRKSHDLPSPYGSILSAIGWLLSTRSSKNLLVTTRITLKVLPPILFCCPMTSEANIAGMAVELNIPTNTPLHFVALQQTVAEA